ncbi:MAG TPA: universal stress protein [Roseiflexaceae bacterium]|nr:universal stress protein [Roseiflexaceae bacterium]
MKTIMVPLDGSTLAEHVLPFVRMLAPILGADVSLFHVIPEMDGMRFQLRDELPDPFASERELRLHSAERLRDNAEGYLVAQVEAMRAAGINATFDVRFGAPAQLIVEACERTKPTMVALATHGYSGIKRWALGSIADKLAHAVHVPLLVVRGSEKPHQGERTLKRILVPLDGSELARQALPLAAKLAVTSQAELLLLTVAAPPFLGAPELVSPTPNYDDMLVALQERLPAELGDQVATLRDRGVKVVPLACTGFPADVIVETAQSERVDLVVMATHGYSGIKRWTLGSVADKVLHASKTPLLLVRAGMPEN